MNSNTALIIEDNLLVRSTISGLLAEIGYSVIEVGTAEQGIAVLSESRVAVLMCDIDLGAGATGLDLLENKSVALPAIVVLMSGDPEPDRLPHGVRYLAKPFTFKQLSVAVGISAPPRSESFVCE